MISPKDSSIIAVIFSQPNITSSELEQLYSKMDNPTCRRICEAHIGKIPFEDLNQYEQEALQEIRSWNKEKIMRINNEEVTTRLQERESRRGNKLMEMYRKGIIRQEVLVLYGISGNLPTRNAMQTPTGQEASKQLFRDRLRSRYGPNWESRLPFFGIVEQVEKHNWLKEGF